MGPVSAPAWPSVRTLVDRQEFGVLITAGTFLHRYVDEIRIEKNDSKKKIEAQRRWVNLIKVIRVVRR